MRRLAVSPRFVNDAGDDLMPGKIHAILPVSDIGEYRAVIIFNGKYKHLGYFDTPEEAAARYERKARELFGEYYREGT